MQKSFKEELAGCVYGIREPFNLDVWADIFINLALLVSVVLLVLGAGFSISYYRCLRRLNGN